MVNISNLLTDLDLKKVNNGTSSGSIWLKSKGDSRTIYSPVDGNPIADVIETDDVSYKSILKNAEESFVHWRKIPAPQRGEIVRQIGNELRKKKNSLGELVSYEMGKSLQEGLGEVQEMIDICDFSVGLSRQLYGLTMHSERPGHRMYEQWHPLGIVAIISSFNFPVAVWSWNAMIALVCGNVCLWKPSKKTPLSAIATQKIISNVFEKNNVDEGICSLVIDCSERKIGTEMLNNKKISLISATGSTAMGKYVARIVGDRLGKTLLELGGNNAIIVSNKADLNIALRAAVFGAVGTAGQRCTSTRRLIVHKDIFEEFKNKLVNAYGQIKIGNPLDKENHMGPLIDRGAVKMYLDAIEKINKEGGKEVVVGGELSGNKYQSGCYVKPAIYEVKNEFSIVQDETFAPILYLIKYSTLDEAIRIQNDVPQGLSSSIMTKDLSESEQFLSAQGSDCGIANVNIGTSGAEIGGAFGG